MALKTPQGRAPPPVALKEASATATTFSCGLWRGRVRRGVRWRGSRGGERESSGTVGGGVWANAVIADSSNPVVSNRRIGNAPLAYVP